MDIIDNFNQCLESFLDPFNTELTEMIGELNSIKIDKLNTYTISLVNKLEEENTNILNSLTIINESDSITTFSNDYIATLNTNKTQLTTIFDNKALPTTPLIRPTLLNITDSNKSLITKQYVYDEVLKYSLPNPIPNTKLYVNKECTALIWT